MKAKLSLVGALICIGAFIYLAAFLVNNAIPLNIVTWTLWTMLDIVIARSMFKTNHASRRVMTSFAVGAGIIAVITIVQLVQGKTTWSWTYKETITLVCFAIAFAVSQKSNNLNLAVNMSTTAMFIAGFPTLVDAWNNPTQQNALFWGLCAFGGFIQLLGSDKGFTSRYFPVGVIVLNGSIAALAMGLIKH